MPRWASWLLWRMQSARKRYWDGSRGWWPDRGHDIGLYMNGKSVCMWKGWEEFQAWIWRRGTGLGGGKGDCALLKLNCRQWRKSLPPTARLNGVDFLSSSTEAHGRWFMWKYKWYPKLSHPTQSVQRTTPTLHVVREELLTPATTLTPPKKAAFTAAAEICSTCGKSKPSKPSFYFLFLFSTGPQFSFKHDKAQRDWC